MCFALFLVGLYGVLTKRDLVKIILSLSIMGYSANLFLILFGYKDGATYAILTEGAQKAPMVDPLPQALVLTSIVIGVGVTGVMLTYALRMFKTRHSLDINDFKETKW